MHSRSTLLLVSAVILLPASVLPSRGFATDLVNANASGGVGSGSLFEIGSSSVGAGVYSDNDAAAVSSVEFSEGSMHLVIGDASFFSGFFFGGEGLGTDNEIAFYQLRLEGSISGGLQAWKVVPLTLAAEDLSYIKTPAGSRATALLGTTVYLPVHLSTKSQVLFVALGHALKSAKDFAVTLRGTRSTSSPTPVQPCHAPFGEGSGWVKTGLNSLYTILCFGRISTEVLRSRNFDHQPS